LDNRGQEEQVFYTINLKHGQAMQQKAKLGQLEIWILFISEHEIAER